MNDWIFCPKNSFSIPSLLTLSWVWPIIFLKCSVFYWWYFQFQVRGNCNRHLQKTYSQSKRKLHLKHQICCASCRCYSCGTKYCSSLFKRDVEINSNFYVQSCRCCEIKLKTRCVATRKALYEFTLFFGFKLWVFLACKSSKISSKNVKHSTYIMFCVVPFLFSDPKNNCYIPATARPLSLNESGLSSDNYNFNLQTHLCALADDSERPRR